MAIYGDVEVYTVTPLKTSNSYLENEGVII